MTHGLVASGAAMSRWLLASCAAVVAVALAMTPARADEHRASAAFAEASQRAAAGDATAIDAFEAIGNARPPTRWTDDAWAEAARLAEARGDFARARRAHEQVIELGTTGDRALVERSKAALARLAEATGAGQWDAIAAEHARLVEAANAGGDPQDELAALEQFARAHPRYPRAAQVRHAIALGWEREGDTERALAWYREAKLAACGLERMRATLELARAAIRADELDLARAELDALETHRADGRACEHMALDTTAIANARARLAIAEQRRTVRIALALVLAVLVVVAIVVMRRDAKAWRGLGRQLVRPPVEVLFLLPIAIVIVVVAQTGNPRVAGAVTLVAIGGVGIAYLAGTSLELARAAAPLTRLRLATHAAAALLAVGLVAYLAIDRYRLIDLLRETVVELNR